MILSPGELVSCKNHSSAGLPEGWRDLPPHVLLLHEVQLLHLSKTGQSGTCSNSDY